MATVHITVLQARGRTPQNAMVADSIPIDSITVASSGTDSDVAGIAGVEGAVWDVVVDGGNVYAAFGTNPDASVDPGRHLILDGERVNFRCMADGEEISIKDA